MLKYLRLLHNASYMVKLDTFMYSCRLLLRPDWGSFRCAWVSHRSCTAKPFSPAASKLLLSCAHALMSWGVYPLCWIKRQSHCFALDGEGQGGGVVFVRLEGSRDGPHLVKSSGEESTKERKKRTITFSRWKYVCAGNTSVDTYPPM